MNKEIMKQAGFEKEVEKVEEGKCPFCNTIINLSDFTDPLSLKEFKISGLCQSCQNTVFTQEEG